MEEHGINNLLVVELYYYVVRKRLQLRSKTFHCL